MIGIAALKGDVLPRVTKKHCQIPLVDLFARRSSGSKVQYFGASFTECPRLNHGEKVCHLKGVSLEERSDPVWIEEQSTPADRGVFERLVSAVSLPERYGPTLE